MSVKSFLITVAIVGAVLILICNCELSQGVA